MRGPCVVRRGQTTQLLPSLFGGGKSRRVLKAELFDTGGISVKAMAHITREAQNQGPAWLAKDGAPKETQDDESRNALFSDGSYGGCRDVERCLSRLRELS